VAAARLQLVTSAKETLFLPFVFALVDLSLAVYNSIFNES